eukprot:gnl/Chilomastix_cuspidata/7861.p3 GENE.gnl/Chilomastix_cuspidata/7861~~gnl/Chilomastix_cuspidata/7861.p3  ORF type:complete len:100 (+),score=10.66 gnl/Chilomastix_cuspidata/7861:143-442(+)
MPPTAVESVAFALYGRHDLATARPITGVGLELLSRADVGCFGADVCAAGQAEHALAYARYLRAAQASPNPTSFHPRLHGARRCASAPRLTEADPRQMAA